VTRTVATTGARPFEMRQRSTRDASATTTGSSGYSRLNGRYQITSLIGTGGMASVYAARDEFLGRDVAVKLFESPSAALDDVSSQERELQILARLNHHSLVSLLDAGVHERTDPSLSRMFLVMELVRGSTLKQLVASRQLSSRDIAHIGTDLAEGLRYIHAHGIIHRDVKPANVLMVSYSTDDDRPRAKLADFGIALIADAVAQPTRSGTTTGTAAYLSPEQALGESVGPASDIYSLGLLLLECFTRTLAFPGSAIESAVARLSRHPAIPSTLPDGWAELLAAMTSRRAENRPSIGDVIRSLQDLARQQGVSRHGVAASTVVPAGETARMAAVDRYEILDTPSDGAFDRITGLAARLFDVPIAIVSIVDHDRIWFKSHHGVDVDEIGRDAGLCASAVLHERPWVVTDARTDVRAMANPLVAGQMGVQFYAGVPLRTHDGHNLGTLCVLDYKPREVTPAETRNLEDLAAMVMSELELRLATRRALV
jgi:hypothetical protein